MKTSWQKVLTVPLILAVIAAPLYARDNDGDGTNASAPPQPPPAAAPVTPPPPADQLPTNGVTNSATATQKKHKVPGDHTPVRIDGTGIHVGGPDPVDIGFDMHGSNHGLFGKSGIPTEAVVITIVAITAPLIFLIVLVACFFGFRHRRQRMLHETIRQMVDKGMPIPPDLLGPPARVARVKTRNDLRNGLVLIGIGLGLVVTRARFGWILVFVGAAFLLIWYIEKKANPGSNDPTNK